MIDYSTLPSTCTTRRDDAKVSHSQSTQLGSTAPPRPDWPCLRLGTIRCDRRKLHSRLHPARSLEARHTCVHGTVLCWSSLGQSDSAIDSLGLSRGWMGLARLLFSSVECEARGTYSSTSVRHKARVLLIRMGVVRRLVVGMRNSPLEGVDCGERRTLAPLRVLVIVIGVGRRR